MFLFTSSFDFNEDIDSAVNFSKLVPSKDHLSQSRNACWDSRFFQTDEGVSLNYDFDNFSLRYVDFVECFRQISKDALLEPDISDHDFRSINVNLTVLSETTVA